MADIYPGAGVEGVIDITKARDALKLVGGMGEGVRRAHVAEITAGALLDIAWSLRSVGAEASLAMASIPDYSEAAVDEVEASAEDFFIAGDLVMVKGSTTPGEITGFGQSEGSMYADVAFVDGARSRVWLDNLTRLHGDEGADETDTTETLRRLNAAADAEGEIEEPIPPLTVIEDLTDDIDADFDGDVHSAAATALDVLKANEAERKAAKKKGTKK